MARYGGDLGVVQNAVSGPIRVGRDRAQRVALQTGSANHAAADLKLQGSNDGVVFGDVGMFDPADHTTARASLVGASKFGEVPVGSAGWEYYQVKRVDATGAGIAQFYLTIQND